MNFVTNIDETFCHSFIRILVSVNTTSSDSTISSTGKPTEICKSSSDEKSLTITLESKITPVWILKFTFFKFLFSGRNLKFFDEAIRSTFSWWLFRWINFGSIFGYFGEMSCVVEKFRVDFDIEIWFRSGWTCSTKFKVDFRLFIPSRAIRRFSFDLSFVANSHYLWVYGQTVNFCHIIERLVSQLSHCRFL